MEKTGTSDYSVIQENSGIIHPREPRKRSVKVKTLNDYPDVPRVFLDVVQNYSNPRLAGPPICDELVALVQHMFTEEEAAVFRHLPPTPRGKTAKAIAAAEHRPVAEVSEILDRLANTYYYMASRGKGEKARYSLIPMFPGSMEQIMFRNSLDGLTDWHRRFAELFNELYTTGYVLDYNKYPANFVRYLPVEQSIETHPMAWPSDRLEEILDRYDSFAVTYCQCRTTEHLLDRECNRPKETCLFMGEYSKKLVDEGRIRKIERKEALDIKREAEASGLVTWMFNERAGSPVNISCSCCGCCCLNMRMVTEFNMPAVIAPPHFMPKWHNKKCDSCGKCAKICTMGAITVNTLEKNRTFKTERCIGCGLCVIACDKQHALDLEPVPNSKKPPRNWLSLVAQALPNTIRNSRHAKKIHEPGYEESST